MTKTILKPGSSSINRKWLLKPIETIYHGYRFRSRLEAKWAVFFDALDIKLEYEVEGYDLGPLGYYLPDFWLPGIHCFAEVKPETFTEVEWNKASALPKNCLALDGMPDNKYYCVCGDEDGNGDYCTYENYLRGDTFFCADLIMSKYEGRIWWVWNIDAVFSSYDKYTAAVNAARAARFERGDGRDGSCRTK